LAVYHAGQWLLPHLLQSCCQAKQSTNQSIKLATLRSVQQ
jgi:hypothetical protein